MAIVGVVHRLRALVPLALLALLGLLAGCGASRPEEPTNNVGTRITNPVAKSVLSLPLTDSTGRTRHLSDFNGKVLVVSDSMTLCQETCPLDTTSIVAAAKAVDAAGLAKKVEFLTITVDPERDTPNQLAHYRALFGGPSNWLTLTGSAADVHKLWKFFGVYWKKVPQDTPPPKNWLTGKTLTYDIEHSDEVFFLKGGTERFILDGAPHLAKGDNVPEKLNAFLSKDGHRNVTNPAKTAWTIPQALQTIGWLVGKRVPA